MKPILFSLTICFLLTGCGISQQNTVGWPPPFVIKREFTDGSSITTQIDLVRSEMVTREAGTIDIEKRRAHAGDLRAIAACIIGIRTDIQNLFANLFKLAP